MLGAYKERAVLGAAEEEGEDEEGTVVLTAEDACEGADFSSQDGEVRPQRRTIAVAVARQIGGCNTTCSD